MQMGKIQIMGGVVVSVSKRKTVPKPAMQAVRPAVNQADSIDDEQPLQSTRAAPDNIKVPVFFS